MRPFLRSDSTDSLRTSSMDCKPIGLTTIMLITFWCMLSYVTDSYFIIFLIFSNFILLFACCVSLSGYVLRRYIDSRHDSPANVLEPVPTISNTTPFILPDYPPSYEEATRNLSVVPCHVIQGHVAVPACVICASHQHIQPHYLTQQSSNSISENMVQPPSYTPNADTITSTESTVSSSSVTNPTSESSTHDTSSQVLTSSEPTEEQSCSTSKTIASVHTSIRNSVTSTS